MQWYQISPFIQLFATVGSLGYGLYRLFTTGFDLVTGVTLGVFLVVGIPFIYKGFIRKSKYER